MHRRERVYGTREKMIVPQVVAALCAFLVLGGGNALGQAAPAQVQEAPHQAQPAQNQQPAQPQTQQQSSQAVQPAKELTPPTPVLDIKRLESEQPMYAIELRNVLLADLFRIMAHDYNLNIMIDPRITGSITASFTNITLEEALEAIAEMTNLSIEKKGKVIRISPNLVTRTIVLRFVEAKKVLESAGTPGAAGSTGVAGLLSDKGKILLGQQQNSLTVIDYPSNVKRIEEYLAVVDHKLETRVFKLKYLKADEISGVTQTTMTTTQTIGAEGATATTTATTTKQQ